MEPLPLGAVRPAGWLEQQLRIQADGLSGHLDEFWPDVQNSQWFGGDGDDWERAPYWLDGVIPLAFLLDDPQLFDRVSVYVNTIIARQHKDGWLGPKREDLGRQDIWPHFIILKALAQYHEATGDGRVLKAMERGLRRLDRHIDTAPLFDWAKFRWFESLISVDRLYEKTGKPWLPELALKLQCQGFDWVSFFEQWPLTEPTPKGRWNYMGHVVNNAMALKAGPLWARHSGLERDRRAAGDMMEKLDRYHGMPTGIFTGDECLAGTHPSQGTELCAVVEYMYSLEVLLSLLGDPALSDRLEKIAFNALPATFSPDMWSHQYDQQANQVECSVKPGRLWTTNGPEANIFGLEPNYGCCTANLSQGWPKFAAHLWMRTPDGGLAAVVYAPSMATCEIQGARVEAKLETEYPFRESLHFEITTSRPVRFPLRLRIPAWCSGATVVMPGGGRRWKPAGTLFQIEREWKNTTKIEMTLPMRPRCLRGYADSVAIERGPLVYALAIGEEWRRINEGVPGRELPHGDWEVYPTTPWNYALDISEETVADDLIFTEQPLGKRPFSPEGAPVSATAKGRRLPGWRLVNGSADTPPPSPVDATAPLERLTLIPYGCTNLRITEFPVLKR